MNVGELFVNLGIKGSDKTINALRGTKTTLGEVKSMSLEMKAALIGAFYALERLISTSGLAGTNLTNFEALTGQSAKQLQQWQFAARQAGVANEEFTGSLKSVQTAMTNMLLGKGAPEGLALLANQVGFDPKRARDTFYVMEQLQKFARQAPPDVGNSVLKSFGLSEGTIAAMRRNMFRPEMLNKAPVYSDSEIKQLDRANIAWSNLATKIEMAFGRFNARHGLQLVSDVSKLTDKIIRLADSFVILSEKLKLFEHFGKVFEGWSLIFESISGSVNNMNSAIESPETGSVVKQGASNVWDFLKFLAVSAAGAGDAIGGKINQGLGMPQGLLPALIGPPGAPAMQATPTGQKTSQVNIEQNLNFQHDGKDAVALGGSVRKANQDAFRQFSQGQVS